MRTVHKNRLLKLADFLMRVKPKAFDLNSWVSLKEYDDFGNETAAHNKDPKTVLCGILEGKKEFNCGTTACAVGFCPIVFPRHFKYKGDSDVILKSFENDEVHEYDGALDAAEEFFGLDNDQAEYFFMPDSYPSGPNTTAKEVAKRIKEVVKKGFPSQLDLLQYEEPCY